MKKEIIIAAVATLFLSSCEKEILQQSETEDLIVVQAYLYDGESVDDVFLSSLLSYGGEDTVNQRIADANVEIIYNNNTYPLVASDSVGQYYYPGSDLVIQSGEHYQIEIDYFNKTTTAETTVPEPPTGLSISDEVIYFDPIVTKGSTADISPIEVTWDESGDDYFYILVENIEEDPTDIFTGCKGDDELDDFTKFRKITVPIQGNSFVFLPAEIVQQWGMHLVRVFRVNNEYANLYESNDQDSRDLNEPLTNITNGLGVFTAFSADSLYFEILPE